MPIKGEWTKEEDDYLREHYPNERAVDIGAVLGRTKSSIQHRACRLKIGKDKEGFFNVRSNACSGINSGNFKGYRRVSKFGYIILLKPDHPSSEACGIIFEHRFVMEEALGFPLPKNFVVHHINGDKKDNRLENLAVMTMGAHTALHNRKGRGKNAKGSSSRESL